MGAVIHLITSGDFLLGALAGALGLGIAFALRGKGLDWGLIWGLSVVGGLLLAGRSGWLALGRISSDQPWAVPAALVTAAVTGYGVNRMKNEPVGGLAVALSIAGIWATVPDTERIAVIVGVTAVMVWAWWPFALSMPGIAGSIAYGMIAAWATTVGGLGRATGLIGGLGALVSLAISARFVPRTRPWVWLGAHFILVVTWSRWAGLSETIPTALTIGVLMSGLVMIGGRFLERLDPLDHAAENRP